MSKKRILVVCMGNICRSPTAEGVLRAYLERAGLADQVEVDSAGTHSYHIGEPPDSRTQKAALRRGYDLSKLRGRRVTTADFLRFDHVLAMDRENLAMLRDACPTEEYHRLALFLDAADVAEDEVPDPYYGGPEGFEHVLDLVEAGASGWVNRLKNRLM